MEIDFGIPLELNAIQSETKFDEEVVGFLKDWFSQSDTVEVQTSGSTGKPKIFRIEKQRMLNSAKLTCDFLNLRQGNTALLCLPVQYISGKMMVVRSILRGLKLTIVPPSIHPLENFHNPIDFCAMTPLQVENSLTKVNQVQKLIIGGAAVSDRLEEQLNGKTTKIYETYGMSETLSHIALKEINPKAEVYFTLFDGIEISRDSRNCLKINAPQLNPRLLQTNDIVEIPDPKHFRFLGRADNVINSGGAKIYPEVLEGLLKKQIQNEIVFLGSPDETYGQKLILVIEQKSTKTDGKSAKNQQTPDADRNKLRDIVLNFPFEKSYFKPKEILFVPKIPRTPNGKVNRPKLLKTCLNLSPQSH